MLRGPVPTICMIVNFQALQQKVGHLASIVKILKQAYNLELIKEEEVDEDTLIAGIEASPPHMLLVPLTGYQSWKKLGNYFGSSHPTPTRYAGYITEPISPQVLTDPGSKSKQLILNFNHLDPAEILKLMSTLTDETKSSGIMPLINPKCLIYCDRWMSYEGQGQRLDHLLSLAEIRESEWHDRATSIRILFMALWSLVYEEGRGKLEIVQQAPTQNHYPLAYFQIAADLQGLWMRVIFSAPHLRTPQEVLRHFWAIQSSKSKPVSLLYEFSDSIRVHSLAGTQDLEIVVGLLRTSPSEKSPQQIRSFWIEPIAAFTLTERAYDKPSADQPQLKNFPQNSSPVFSIEKAKQNKASHNSTSEIRELKTQLKDKEDKIRELRSGGIGTAATPPPPDPESLLDAFQTRYAEARFQIRQCELQIEAMRKKGANESEIIRIKQLIDALLNREKAWIKKLAQVIAVYKKSHIKP